MKYFRFPLRSVVILLSASLNLPGVFAADGGGQPLPTVVVAPTVNQGIASWQPAIGEGLAHMIVNELNKLDNMKVLESLALEDLREERKLGESGEVAQGEAVQKGQWKGADYTFKSVVTRFGAKESNFGGGGYIPVPVPTPRGPGFLPFGGGGFSVKKSEHQVQIDWRIIDNASREIVKGASGSAVGIEKGGGFNFSSWGGGGFSDNREFMDSALGKATVKAIALIIEKVRTLQLAPGARANVIAQKDAQASFAQRNVRGSVVLVDGKEIWTSLGAKHGFFKGDKVKLYKPVEKKNSQGVVVTTIFKEAGEMVLSTVQKDKSMGEFNGAGPVAEGWAAAAAELEIDSIEKTTE